MAETEMSKRERYRIVEALHKPRWSAEHVSMAASQLRQRAKQSREETVTVTSFWFFNAGFYPTSMNYTN